MLKIKSLYQKGGVCFACKKFEKDKSSNMHYAYINENKVYWLKLLR